MIIIQFCFKTTVICIILWQQADFQPKASLKYFSRNVKNRATAKNF